MSTCPAIGTALRHDRDAFKADCVAFHASATIVNERPRSDGAGPWLTCHGVLP